MGKPIQIVGASTHNLQNIDCEFPRGQLVVVTGPSGAGKSSLVFDTLYVEALRRLAYPLEGRWWQPLEKPRVREIRGLSYPIAFLPGLRQRRRLPTVLSLGGLSHEWAQIAQSLGREHCTTCGETLARSSLTELITAWKQASAGTSVLVLSPLPTARKEQLVAVEHALRGGFSRAYHDGMSLALERILEGDSRWSDELCFIAIDRLSVTEARLDERIRTAVSHAEKLDGRVYFLVGEEGAEREILFSRHPSCPKCKSRQERVVESFFLGGKRSSSCSICGGAGTVVMINETACVNSQATLDEQAFRTWKDPKLRPKKDEIKAWFKARKLKGTETFEKLSAKKRQQLMYGEGRRIFPFFPALLSPQDLSLEGGGVCGFFIGRWHKSKGTIGNQFVREEICPNCNGSRFRPEVLAFEVGGRSLKDLLLLPLEELHEFLRNRVSPGHGFAAHFLNRVQTLLDFGLGYLHLSRGVATLSAGELQRLELARELSDERKGAMFLLDEPSAALHPVDLERLLKRLEELVSKENAFVIVDHHEEFLRRANTVITLGPGSGARGGQVVAAQQAETPALIRAKRDPMAAQVTAVGMCARNLKNVSLEIPLGVLTGVCGISGSGKSTALFECVGPALEHYFSKRSRDSEVSALTNVASLTVPQELKRVVMFNERARLAGSRSTISGFLGIRQLLAKLYAFSEQARVGGFGVSDFLGRTERSRCERCGGRTAQAKKCRVCKGIGVSSLLRDILWRGLSFEFANRMRIDELFQRFQRVPKLSRITKLLCDVGLGYLDISQGIGTLSSGEKQRVLLSAKLVTDSRPTLFLLDEPCRGLAESEISLLLSLLDKLIDAGHSVCAIEHRPYFLRAVDQLIEFGPGAGAAGGEIVFAGSVIEAKNKKSSAMRAFL